jgi:hypothetical protein
MSGSGSHQNPIADPPQGPERGSVLGTLVLPFALIVAVIAIWGGLTTIELLADRTYESASEHCGAVRANPSPLLIGISGFGFVLLSAVTLVVSFRSATGRADSRPLVPALVLQAVSFAAWHAADGLDQALCLFVS